MLLEFLLSLAVRLFCLITHASQVLNENTRPKLEQNFD